MGVPVGPFYVTTGQYQVAAGSETVLCSTVRLPTRVDVDVVKIQADLTTGGHHLILYRVNDTTESPTPTKCDSVRNITSSVPLIIAMTPGAAGTTYQQADIMFCGSLTQLYAPGIPPSTTSYPLNPGFFKGNSTIDFTKIKLFGLTTHQHWTGKEATISKSTGPSDPGTMLYDNTSWDAAPLKAFDDASLVSFGPNEGIRWQCTYDTADGSPPPAGYTKFGESARTNEMCFLWAYHYPSAGRFIGQGDCWQ